VRAGGEAADGAEVFFVLKGGVIIVATMNKVRHAVAAILTGTASRWRADDIIELGIS
jgi:chloramphenicol 3-O-phosphotransferase